MMFHYEIEAGVGEKGPWQIEACGVMPKYMTADLSVVNCRTCLAAVELQLL